MSEKPFQVNIDVGSSGDNREIQSFSTHSQAANEHWWYVDFYNRKGFKATFTVIDKRTGEILNSESTPNKITIMAMIMLD